MSIRNGEAAPDRERNVDLGLSHGAALTAGDAAQGRERGSAFSVRVDRDANGDHALNSSEIGTDRSLAFGGTAEAGQDIVVSYTNGGPVQYYGVVTADADGRWTLPFGSEMADQNVHFTFAPAGEAEVNVDVAVDAQAPEFARGVFSTRDMFYIRDPEIGVVGMASQHSGYVEGAERVELLIDGKVFGSSAVDPDGYWIINLHDWVAPEGDGGPSGAPLDPLPPAEWAPHTVQYRAIDAHGNSTIYSDETVSTKIDLVDSDTDNARGAVPQAVVKAAHGGNDADNAPDAGKAEASAFSVRVDGDANGDHALNSSEIHVSRSLAFSGTAEAGQDIAVSYARDGSVQYYGAVTADGDGNWTLPFAAGMADQNIRVTFEPEGEAPVSVDVVIDTTAPEIADATYAEGAFSGHVDETATVDLVIDGSTFGTLSTEPDGSWTSGVIADFAASDHVVQYVVTDAHGNQRTYDGPAVTTADGYGGNHGNGGKQALSAFSVHVDGDANGDNALNASEIDADKSLSFSGTADAGETVYVSYFKGGAVQGLGSAIADADGNWTFAYNKTGLEDQKIRFVFEHNNTPFDLDVVIDTTAPVISDTSFSTDTGVSDTDRLTNDFTPTFSGHIDEQATVKALIGGKAAGLGQSTDGTWTVGPVAALGDGEYAVQYVATDVYGNTSQVYDAKPLTIDTFNGDTVAISSVNRSRVAHATGKVDGEETMQVRLVVDGRTAEAVTVDVTNGTWSGDIDTHTLRAGHKLEATGVDDAGNSTEVATRIFSNAPPPPPPAPVSDPWPTPGANGDTFVHDGQIYTWWYDLGAQKTVPWKGVWTSVPYDPSPWVHPVAPPPGSSPLSLDLNENGRIDTASIKKGILFDLDNDGTLNQISWLSGGDGLLVLDKNGNGSIDNGSELFGPTERYSDGSRINEGYIELSAYDLNGDKVIDQNDSIFEDLQVWVDGNMNAVTDEGELLDIADLGVVSISIDPTDLDYTDAEGVYHKNTSTVQLEDGKTMVMEDVFFEDKESDSALAGDDTVQISGMDYAGSEIVGDVTYDFYVADNANGPRMEDEIGAIVA
ncbi:Ig-like domain-containing protein [Pelagibacterium halotolerans]|uniref:Ig-like domain-containing protein n=1 Tax=Pelagibacterium halotolerans TaxID=531813 RepID=UPI00384B5933